MVKRWELRKMTEWKKGRELLKGNILVCKRCNEVRLTHN